MFQLKRVTLAKHPILGSTSFDLTDLKDQPTKSYKTVIIGSNGTGKSTLLYFITKTFITIKRLQIEAEEILKFECDFEIEYSINKHTFQVTSEDKKLRITRNGKEIQLSSLVLPSKIIVSTLSITERFPLNFITQNIGSTYNSYDEFYEYFGIRSRRGQLVQKQYTKSAIEVFFNKFFEDKSRASCAEVFKKLGYEPRLQVRYGNPKDRINPYSKEKFNIENYLKSKMADSHLTDLTKSQQASLVTQETQDRIIQLYNHLESNFGETTSQKKKKFIVTIELEGDISLQQEIYRLYGNELSILKKLRVLEMEHVSLFRNGKKVEISHASSGEQQLLSTFLTLASAAEDDSLVLLDEPDISLHPEWQSQFIELLDQTMERYNGIHYVLVTHSPYLISDLKEESANIVRLESKNSRVDTAVIQDNTYGKSLEQITLDVFNMPTSRNAHLSGKIVELMNLLKAKKGNIEDSDKNLVRNLVFLTSKLDSNDPLKILINRVEQHLNV